MAYYTTNNEYHQIVLWKKKVIFVVGFIFYYSSENLGLSIDVVIEKLTFDTDLWIWKFGAQDTISQSRFEHIKHVAVNFQRSKIKVLLLKF